MEQMTTNRRFAHISDEPAAFLAGQRARYALTGVSDYQRTIDLAQSHLTQAEDDLMEFNKLAVEAYDIVIDLANDTKEPADRENVSYKVAELRDHALMTLNSIFGDKYAMGGYNTTGTYPTPGAKTPPFTVDPNTGKLFFNGMDVTNPSVYTTFVEPAMKEVLTYDIGISSEMRVAVNGAAAVIFNVERDPITNDVTKVSNLYNTLDDLYTTLKDPTITGVQLAADAGEFITPFQDAQRRVLAAVSEIGGKQNRLEMLDARYQQDAINYIQMKSDAEDADEAELIMQFKMTETVYKAALATGNYVLQPTLMDFIK
jgi:flagellar hook-associated protein 3 FlgL